MTIAERIRDSKRVPGPSDARRLPQDVLLVAALVLTATASFGLGVVAGRESREGEEGVVIERPTENMPAAAVLATSSTKLERPTPKTVEVVVPPAAGGQYVASKTGTKYYFPWCGTAKRIKEENRVWFGSKEEAEAKGYEPAKNCKGL